MNDRQRFHATMHYLPRDRMPIMDFNFWPETLQIWRRAGLPRWVNRRNADAFFGMDSSIDNLRKTGVREGLAPSFRKLVLEDRGEARVLQQRDGVRVLRQKRMASIPHPLAHLLTDRDSWRKHYLPRLDPATRVRYPADWAERVKEWTDPSRPYPVIVSAGSLYGWLRNWLGVKQLSLVLYDDPRWFEEMVTVVADCILGVLGRVLETGGCFDAASLWEDMCYNAGPLLSPRHFRRYLLPHYRRIADLLRSHGVDIIYLDCDGKIDLLVPLWLEAGINCMYPMEVGTWHTDPIAYRRRFGRDLLMMGGFDKHILQGPRAGIEREIYRLLPLVEEGGYIGFPDHRVPPDTPYDSYLYYVERVRSVWGQDVDLRPAGSRPAAPPPAQRFFDW